MLTRYICRMMLIVVLHRDVAMKRYILFLFMSCLFGMPSCAMPEFPDIQGTNIYDCAATEVLPDICREKRDLTLDEAASRLGNELKVWWRDGDRFTVIARSKAKVVNLCCAIQLPMARLPGSDIWTLTVRSPHLNKAILDIKLITPYDTSLGYAQIAEEKWGQWRGPEALSAPQESPVLMGRVVSRDLNSPDLGEMRRVYIYLPPDFDAQKRYPVVYMADGESVPASARIAEPLILQGKIRPMVLIGLVAGRFSNGHDRRGEDYLTGFGKTSTFTQHEAFFLTEVMPMAEKEYGVSANAQDRMLSGRSNGGAWALDTALRHPDMFSKSAAFSVCWQKSGRGIDQAKRPALFMGVGVFEGSCRTVTTRLAAEAMQSEDPVVFRQVVSGHTPLMWNLLFAQALQWAFPATDPSVQ